MNTRDHTADHASASEWRQVELAALIERYTVDNLHETPVPRLSFYRTTTTHGPMCGVYRSVAVMPQGPSGSSWETKPTSLRQTALLADFGGPAGDGAGRRSFRRKGRPVRGARYRSASGRRIAGDLAQRAPAAPFTGAWVSAARRRSGRSHAAPRPPGGSTPGHSGARPWRSGKSCTACWSASRAPACVTPRWRTARAPRRPGHRLVKDNFHQPLSIDALADRVNMSTSSLHHHFKALTAMSPCSTKAHPPAGSPAPAVG